MVQIRRLAVHYLITFSTCVNNTITYVRHSNNVDDDIGNATRSRQNRYLLTQKHTSMKNKPASPTVCKQTNKTNKHAQAILSSLLLFLKNQPASTVCKQTNKTNKHAHAILSSLILYLKNQPASTVCKQTNTTNNHAPCHSAVITIIHQWYDDLLKLTHSCLCHETSNSRLILERYLVLVGSQIMNV